MSYRFTLNTADLKKIAIGAGVAVVGALLTYVSETIISVDFGEWTPIIVAIWSILANAARKFIAGGVITT